ncbi:MAG: tRNA (adenosine(37)-N6)-dimethylallyltransferase MiaA [Tepidisphaerales bacterium]
MAPLTPAGPRADGRPLVCIVGPTASGKSAWALRLAGELGYEILCVDSMTVYRGMDIGTAKPSPAERAAVVHHGLDLVEPTETYTVARFVAYADAVIADARRRGVGLICVGGTPLYFMALFRGLFDGPPADESLRLALQQMPADQRFAELQRVDPVAASRLHPNDTKRVVRALEVYRLTGQPLSAQQTEWAAGTLRHRAVFVAPHWEKEQLNRRINARVKQMIAAGWVEEVRRLPQPLSSTAREAAGYELLLRHLRGELPLDEAVEQIKIATRQLARRQVKWFRRWPEVMWLPGDDPTHAVKEVARRVAGASRPSGGS